MTPADVKDPAVKDPELLIAWIDGLLDPDAKQATGTLRRMATEQGLAGNPEEEEGSRCCLGVLVDEAVKLGRIKGRWEPFVKKTSTQDGTSVDSIKTEGMFVLDKDSPIQVRDKDWIGSPGIELLDLVGLSTNGSHVERFGHWPGTNEEELTEINDSGKHTFWDISDMLTAVLVRGEHLVRLDDDDEFEGDEGGFYDE